MKKLITFLYKKYCEPIEPQKEYSPFEILKKEMTEDEKKQLYISCKFILEQGHFMKVVDMYIAESQDEQLEMRGLTPFYTTDAELERMRRDGVGKIVEKIKLFAGKAIVSPEEEFDKFAL